MDKAQAKIAKKKLRKLSSDLKKLMALVVTEETSRIRAEVKDLQAKHGKRD
jgi:protein-arginine kinase activator protein McsA